MKVFHSARSAFGKESREKPNCCHKIFSCGTGRNVYIFLLYFSCKEKGRATGFIKKRTANLLGTPMKIHRLTYMDILMGRRIPMKNHTLRTMSTGMKTTLLLLDGFCWLACYLIRFSFLLLT